MPIEILVAGFVVIGLIAIAVRFVPRDSRGRAQLPDVVDQSVGMWAIRQVIGDRDDFADEVPETFEVRPTFEEIAYRIGVAGAAKPIVRVIPPPAEAASRPGTPAAVTDPIRRIRSRPGARAGLGLQRRLTAVFACVLAVGVVAVVLTSQPRREGAVLGVTGTPAFGSSAPTAEPSGSQAAPDSAPAELP